MMENKKSSKRNCRKNMERIKNCEKNMHKKSNGGNIFLGKRRCSKWRE
jgi:hypothetical protein